MCRPTIVPTPFMPPTPPGPAGLYEVCCGGLKQQLAAEADAMAAALLSQVATAAFDSNLETHQRFQVGRPPAWSKPQLRLPCAFRQPMPPCPPIWAVTARRHQCTHHIATAAPCLGASPQAMALELTLPAATKDEVAAFKRLIGSCGAETERRKEVIALNKAREEFLFTHRCVWVHLVYACVWGKGGLLCGSFVLWI